MVTTQNRRYSFSSSTSSSLAKRQASAPENAGKATVAKKRAPLGNITNQRNVSHTASKPTLSASSMVACSNKVAKAKKAPSLSNVLPASSSLNVKSIGAAPCKANASLPKNGEVVTAFSTVPAPCSMDVSPSRSNANSVSLDESMSTCDSFRSPEVEYIDRNDVPAVDSIERKTFTNLYISDHAQTADMEMDDKVVNLDTNYTDPQFCTTIACDIYKHLRASELKKRPSTDFMDKVQKDINPSMRAILVDWLVEVAEEYRLVPDTLYLTVNYIDRYLSGNVMNRQRLQLLGVACMMVASKYEEICAPQVEEFCYITDNTYFKEEVLEMESSVLNYLKFEMTSPTVKCFLRRFVRAAQGVDEVPSMHMECMANYIAELSLLDYDMLCYPPSLVAASAIFLAKYILVPSKRPWNCTLQHYTLYQPSDLRECVKDLHRLCRDSLSSTLPAIREKYSQHKYKYVAKKVCPPSIPQELFNNLK